MGPRGRKHRSRRAGGSVTDLDGKKLDFLQGTKLLKNRGILATVPEEYPKILDVLRNLKFIVCYS